MSTLEPTTRTRDAPAPAPAPAPASGLGAATRLGAVHLTVTDLDRSLGYYQRTLGLELRRREGARAVLGVGGADLIVLGADPTARRAGRHAGLYQCALLFPAREALARAIVRLVETRAPVDGLSDHGTHEAVYLADPDGNGIELAADRPREQWPDISGPAGYGAGPAPLDVQGLLATVAGEAVEPVADPGLRVGHVHLHVADLAAAEAFYGDGLGFAVMTRMPSALFVAAGGYHHHVGLNVWRGRGVPPAPADAVGLAYWTLEVAGEDELAALRARLETLGAPVEPRGGALVARDPSGIAVAVVAAPRRPA